uniref:Uncharacterized protein n=1 Tax=Ditylenchus dipsaci TaxID=166011 RepID=A0A915CWD8_9BILA
MGRKLTVKSCSSKSHKSKSKNAQLRKDVLESSIKPINPPSIKCLIKNNVLAPKLTVDAGLVEEVNPFLILPSQPGCVFSSEASSSAPQLPSFWPLSSEVLLDGLELTPYYTHTSAQNGHYPNYLVPANPSEYAIESGFDHSNWALQNPCTSKIVPHHGCPPGTSSSLNQPWGDLTTQNAYYVPSSQPNSNTLAVAISPGPLVYPDEAHPNYPSSWNHCYTDWIQAGSIQPTSEAKSDAYSTLNYSTTRRNEDLVCTEHPQQIDTLLPSTGISEIQYILANLILDIRRPMWPPWGLLDLIFSQRWLLRCLDSEIKFRKYEYIVCIIMY